MFGSHRILAQLREDGERVRDERARTLATRRFQFSTAQGIAGMLCLALAACAGGGSGSDDHNRNRNRNDDDDEDPPPQFQVNEGDVIAELELSAPQEQSFLLRATLPLPRGLWKPGDAKVPLVVANPDGLSARTQVSTASRYPASDDGADVVELIARVDRPAGTSPGDRIRYKVAYIPNDPVAFDASDAVAALLATPGALRLTTRDVFGNEYSADLWRDVRESTGDARTVKDGELARQIRTHEILLPVQPKGGADGTMPHMMAAHAFVTQWSDEDFFSLDLHIHNGMSGLDKEHPDDDALNEIYFDELDLSVPPGWEVLPAFEDPMLGDAQQVGGAVQVPLVRSQQDGNLHVMPRQSHFVRRLVVTKEGAKARANACVRERWLAFCLPGMAPTGQANLSWWNDLSARYFPQHYRIPRLEHVGLDNMRSNLSGDLEHFEENVKAGTMPGYPVVTPALGWAHPWGVKYGGMTGGDEIVFYDGLEVAASGSQEGYRLAQLTARMYIDRERTALYNADGEPTDVDDWLITSGGEKYMPMDFFLLPIIPDQDIFGFSEAPTFQTEAVIAQGKVPAYQEELLSYMAIDFQHYIRYTRAHKVLAWLGNDAIAKLEIGMAAACFHLGFHQYKVNWFGHITQSALVSSISYVDTHPGWGVGFGRGQGWGTDAAVAAYAFADDAQREMYYPWFETIVDMLEEAQADCSGIIQATPSFKYVYRVMQSFEVSIIENMLYGLRTTVFEGRDAARAEQVASVLAKSFQAQIGPLVWRDEYAGPVNWMAVGSPNLNDPPYCAIPDAEDAQSYGADHTYCWADFAYAYGLTNDAVFLEKAKQAGYTTDLYTLLHQSGLDGIAARAPLLALMQKLNGE